LTMTVISNVKI